MKQCIVPITIEAQGNEVTVQGTIHFDTSKVSISNVAGTNTNPDVKVGAGAPKDTQIIVNTTGIQNGDIGLVINFNGLGKYPATTAQAGTKVIANLRFTLLGDQPVGGIELSWNDNIFRTKAGDADAQALSLTPVDGSIAAVGKRSLRIANLITKV